MLVHEMKRVECHDPTCVRASRAHTHVVLTGRRFEEESLDDAQSSAHPPRETPDFRSS